MRLSSAIVALLGVMIVFLGGCSLFPWQSSRYGGESSEVYFLNLGKDEPREVTYTLRLGDNIADVFFAFVNYGGSAALLPTVTPLSADAQRSESAANHTGIARSASPPATPPTAPIRVESDAIAEFNNHPPAFEFGTAGRSVGTDGIAASRVVARAGELVGDSRMFWQYNGSFSPDLAVETRATLRKVVKDNLDHVLNIWVADTEWLDTPNPGSTDSVTPDKVDALADAFLLTGADNDIRDWVTTMIGEPWGDHNFDNLLDQSAYGNTIDILLLDILLDGATSSGVIGFFWGKDNYDQTTGTGANTDYSNERIMFYLDAPMYGQREGGNWLVTDYWPQLVISTLAHEFQHMIHFYQKNVLQSGQDTQRWLNEMASMITEDLVSYQMEVPGPRGVSPVTHSAGTSGAPGNASGWVPFFNGNNDIGVYTWDLSDPAPNYGINYGLGAFLVRNFGGALFVRELVQNPYTDVAAIQGVFDELGYRVSYREALSQWAAAVLTSDEVIVPWEGDGLDAVYNAGGWFESMVGTTVYRLGSINLFNYEYSDGASMLIGPRIYTGGQIGSDSSRPPASVVYYEAGTALSGTLEWQITLGRNTDLVVVAKSAQ